MIRLLERWWRRSWQWLRHRLRRRRVGESLDRSPEVAPLPEPPVMSDRQYERFFLALLDLTEFPEQLRDRLAEREGDRAFLPWLRRYGRACLQNSAAHGELARRLERLAAVATGEVSTIAKDIAQGIAQATKEQPLSPAAAEPSGLGTTPTEPAPTGEVPKESNSEASEIEKQVASYLQQGFEAYTRGDLTGAIAALDAVLNLKPNDHGALYNKGVSLSALGRKEEAIAAYDAALAIQPDYHKALNNKGNALSALGRKEEAIAAYDAALAIKRDYHEAWLNRAIAAGGSHSCRTSVFMSLPPALQDPALDQRGYDGQLACYTAGLQHVPQDSNPEGWGLLYHEMGRAHYFHGRLLSSASVYLAQAVSDYDTALTTGV